MTRSGLPSPLKSPIAMSLGRWPTGNGECGEGRKCPFPSPKRTLRFSLSWLATTMSGLPSRFRSTTAMGPGPLPTGTTTSVNDGATGRSAQVKALANPNAKRQAAIFMALSSPSLFELLLHQARVDFLGIDAQLLQIQHAIQNFRLQFFARPLAYTRAPLNSRSKGL